MSRDVDVLTFVAVSCTEPCHYRCFAFSRMFCHRNLAYGAFSEWVLPLRDYI